MKKILKKGGSVDDCWNTRGVWSNVDDKCERLVEHVHCRNCPVFSSEGKRVLDRLAPVGYLKDWRKTLAIKKKDQAVDTQSVLVFRVSDEWFALSAGCLHEIAEKRAIHRIPRNINTDIAGVVNIGGEVRVCYSLKSILGISDPRDVDDKNKSIATGRFIVALLGNQYYVFFADQISELSLYNDAEVLPVPATIKYKGKNFIAGVIRHNKNNVAVLDADVFQRNLEEIRL